MAGQAIVQEGVIIAINADLSGLERAVSSAKSKLSGVGETIAPALEKTQRAIDKTTASTKDLEVQKRRAAQTVGQFGATISSIGGPFGRLGQVIGNVSRSIGAGGFVGAVLLAMGVLPQLISFLKTTYDEHKRLNEVAQRLDLPVESVKSYSKGMEELAIRIHDAARGFGELSKMQREAFANAGISAGSPGALNEYVTWVATMKGSLQSQIDLLREVGLSYEDAANALKKETKRLGGRSMATRESFDMTVGQYEGNVIGSGPNADVLAKRRSNQQTAANVSDWYAAQADAYVKHREAAERQAAENRKRIEAETEKEVLARRRAAQADWADRIAIEKALSPEEQGALESPIENWEFEDLLDSIRLQSDIQIEKTKDMRDVWNDALGEMASAVTTLATTGKLDFDNLTRSIINNLIRIQMMEGLTSIFSGKSGLGASIGASIGKVFGGGAGTPPIRGNAGGGDIYSGQVRWVGERGPELWVPKTSGTVIPNGAATGMGGTQPIRVEVINKGTPQQAQTATASQTPSGIVVSVVLDDFKRGGPIRQAIKGLR